MITTEKISNMVPLTEGNMLFSGDVMDRAVHAPYDVTHNLLGQ